MILISLLLLGCAEPSKSENDVTKDPIVLYNEGVQLYFSANEPSDYVKACDLFEESAKNSYGNAQFNLGNCFLYGQGRDQSFDKAKSLYRDALSNGANQAAISLASVILFDVPEESEYDYAISLLENETNDGDQRALFMLGVAYYYGRGVPKDYTKALALYEKAAKRGNVLALALLSHIYQLGLYGNQVDLEKAAFWKSILEELPILGTGREWTLEQALSGIYKNGWGVPKGELPR